MYRIGLLQIIDWLAPRTIRLPQQEYDYLIVPGFFDASESENLPEGQTALSRDDKPVVFRQHGTKRARPKIRRVLKLRRNPIVLRVPIQPQALTRLNNNAVRRQRTVSAH